MPEKLHRVTISLPESTIRWVEGNVRKSGGHPSRFIDQLIRNYVKNQQRCKRLKSKIADKASPKSSVTILMGIKKAS